jgi:hypothetical protein
LSDKVADPVLPRRDFKEGRMRKVNWARLTCAVPGLAGVLCIFSGVLAVVDGQYLNAVFLGTALAVNVFAFVGIWMYTGRKELRYF